MKLKKYYYIIYFSGLNNGVFENPECDCIDIHPLKWMNKYNYLITNWIEITEKEYLFHITSGESGGLDET